MNAKKTSMNVILVKDVTILLARTNAFVLRAVERDTLSMLIPVIVKVSLVDGISFSLHVLRVVVRNMHRKRTKYMAILRK
jgi:hypothetical protein